MMEIGAVIFAAMCAFAGLIGIGYIISVNAQATPITDTFGTTLSPSSNSSQGLVTNLTTQSHSSLAPLILLIGAVAVIGAIFALYVASKMFT